MGCVILYGFSSPSDRSSVSFCLGLLVGTTEAGLHFAMCSCWTSELEAQSRVIFGFASFLYSIAFTYLRVCEYPYKHMYMSI